MPAPLPLLQYRVFRVFPQHADDTARAPTRRGHGWCEPGPENAFVGVTGEATEWFTRDADQPLFGAMPRPTPPATWTPALRRADFNGRCQHQYLRIPRFLSPARRGGRVKGQPQGCAAGDADEALAIGIEMNSAAIDFVIQAAAVPASTGW